MRPRPPIWCINCWQAERLRWVNSAQVGCEPNSQGTLQNQPAFSGSPLALEGAASRYNPCIDEDYISQPDNLFRLMAPARQQMLFDNTARSVGGASQAIQERHIAHCTQADPAYGAGVAKALAESVHTPTPNKVV